jgi:hypothetical protein
MWMRANAATALQVATTDLTNRPSMAAQARPISSCAQSITGTSAR